MGQTRQIAPILLEDLKAKMVLLAGPRQCGKTTLARQILEKLGGAYYCWDIDAHRKILREGLLDESSKLWVFDEIHKNPRWRNWLKGQFDLHGSAHPILVTGSAMLDFYNRGGDSLQGRYFFHRLHPFTLAEYLEIPSVKEIDRIPDLPHRPPPSAGKALAELLALGGFPEPLLGSSERKAKRWRQSYGARLLREEIQSLELVSDVDRMELLFDRMPDIVGSVLSINSLREDLEVSFQTVKKWIAIYERNYACFRLPPMGAPRLKAVKKEQKLYLWDWAAVATDAARLENLVALHLLRLRHWMEDVEGEKVELRYFRDTVGHEVDFVLLRDRKPWIAVEVKQSEQGLDSGLRYLLQRVKIPYAFQIHGQGEKDWRPQDINGCRIRILPVKSFLANLP